MQDKVEAKKIAKKVGIPTVPASDQSIKSKKDLIKWAQRIKPPFIIKAQRGGGGMGIRVVNGQMNYEEMMSLTLGVQRQISGAFSDADFFLEKYLPEVKHIEFQILGDGKNAVHLGERECSIQRRFQKLVEESPSAALDADLRAKMGGWAVKIAEYLRYEGAATVEFLLDIDKNFYFMEVNPRIQVEHPVTEAVTGDIVEQQIKSRGESDWRLGRKAFSKRMGHRGARTPRIREKLHSFAWNRGQIHSAARPGSVYAQLFAGWPSCLSLF